MKMPNALSATQAAQKIKEGWLSSTELVTACLKRIDETEGQLKAWAHLDRDYALAQADELDKRRQAGKPTGPLYGIPVGLKDIVDTKDLPTECGSPIFRDRKPKEDARIVEKLRDAGAIILGKTVSTELAFMHPAETRNPHNTEHTPGGSSSGSAAAVAAYNVPLAIGTQTNGSVIRPAAFCGTYGFKPTRGLISRSGILQTSRSLDQVGVFARSIDDVALLSEVIGGYDQRDELSYPYPRPEMQAGAAAKVPADPELVWFDLPFNDRLTDDAREGLETILEELGGRVTRMESPKAFEMLVEAQRIIHEFEFCMHLTTAVAENWDNVSETLKPIIERGRGITETQYQNALSSMAKAGDFFEEFYKDYDAIVAPSAAGEAPQFDNGTGDPVFCTIWTLCGLPSVSIPLLVGNKGLPIGLQLIGGLEEDDRLLRTANWMLTQLQQDAG